VLRHDLQVGKRTFPFTVGSAQVTKLAVVVKRDRRISVVYAALVDLVVYECLSEAMSSLVDVTKRLQRPGAVQHTARHGGTLFEFRNTALQIFD
jgi:hypothetical protein